MKVRTLIFCGDAWHPAEDVRRGLSALGDERFDFDFVTATANGWCDILKDVAVIIVAKTNQISAVDQRPWMTGEIQAGLRDFVQRGGGLFLIHGGTCYKDWPDLRRLTGGAFVQHPDQCVVTVNPNAGHPLTAGVEEFAEKDEHYIVALDATDLDVFLNSHSEHGTQPAGWTRQEGAGRVCAVTPGHNLAVWLNPEYQKLLRNGLEWLAKLN